MATITLINGTDNIKDSRSVINNNFTNLNNDKVEKITGKGLSTEDYTTTEKNKLAGIEAGNEDFYRYSIVRTVDGSGNITVAIKNYLGTDPSATVPVKVQIGDTIRTITSALSVTNAGYNYYNAGSTELATKEIDLFTYLFWYSTAGGGAKMGIGVCRLPGVNNLSEVNTLITDVEKGFAFNFDTNQPGSVPAVNIGRFNAILSAGPGYTWSIPTNSEIVNKPIYETRELSFTPTVTVDNSQTMSGNANFSTYKIIGNQLIIKYRENWTSLSGTCYSILTTKPFQDNYGNYTYIGVGDYYSNDGHKICQIFNDNTGKMYRGPYGGGALNSGPGSIIDNLNLTI